jgi:hypothetical protein
MDLLRSSHPSSISPCDAMSLKYIENYFFKRPTIQSILHDTLKAFTDSKVERSERRKTSDIDIDSLEYGPFPPRAIVPFFSITGREKK